MKNIQIHQVIKVTKIVTKAKRKEKMNCNYHKKCSKGAAKMSPYHYHQEVSKAQWSKLKWEKLPLKMIRDQINDVVGNNLRKEEEVLVIISELHRWKVSR